MSRTFRIIGTILLFFAIGFYLIATVTGDVLTVAEADAAYRLSGTAVTILKSTASFPDFTGNLAVLFHFALLIFPDAYRIVKWKRKRQGGRTMKRIFCLFLALALLAAPAVRADYEGEPQRCVSLTLACNPSTGYEWLVSSSDETVAQADDLEIAPQETDPYLQGAPAVHNFRITGAAAGTAEITFSYQRPWESVQPLYRFTVHVTVDEGLNVITGSEITLPGTWEPEMETGGIAALEAMEPDEDGNQRFLLSALAEGFETIRFYPEDPEIAEVFTYQVVSDGQQLYVWEISFRWQERDMPFAPEFLFSTTDFEGNPVTEQILAGHSLTILNFWEPWCGPCVGEMPDLQKLSQEYADKGVQVIGVFATPDSDEDVQAVLDRTGVTYPILRYTDEFDFLQTGYVPTTVIIGSSGGIVKDSFAGAMDYDSWVELIEELL